MIEEQAPLLTATNSQVVAVPHASEETGGKEGWKHWLGEILESRITHVVLLTLIALDGAFVFTDLGYTFLTPGTCNKGHPKPPESPPWLETLSHISLAITTLFLIEIPLETWAFGWGWWIPWGPIPHAGLHLLDALVIIGTFIVEVFLKGKERELASLLILLRLWRLIKLVGGVAVGVGEWDEQSVTRLLEAENKVMMLEREIASLRRTSPEGLDRSNLSSQSVTFDRGFVRPDGNIEQESATTFKADVRGPSGDPCEREQDGGDGHEDQTNVWKT